MVLQLSWHESPWDLNEFTSAIEMDPMFPAEAERDNGSPVDALYTCVQLEPHPVYLYAPGQRRFMFRFRRAESAP